MLPQIIDQANFDALYILRRRRWWVKGFSSATTFKVGKLLVLRQYLVAIYFNQPGTGAY